VCVCVRVRVCERDSVHACARVCTLAVYMCRCVRACMHKCICVSVVCLRRLFVYIHVFVCVCV